MASRLSIAGLVVWVGLVSGALQARAADPVTLHGAVQFNDEHVFTRTLFKFEELTRKYYG